MSNTRKLTLEEQRQKMLFLTGVSEKKNLNESVTSTKNAKLLKYKRMADGKIYGIVQESQQFFVKVCSNPNKENINVTDFAYIGGEENKLNEKFTSFPKADNRLRLKEMVLRESFSREEEEVEDESINEEIPLNKDIDAKKPEPVAEPTPTEVPVEAPVDNVEPEAVDNSDIADYNPEVDTTETPAEPAPSSGNGDDADTVSEIQSLLGKLSNEYAKLPEVDPTMAKSAINNIISSTKTGVAKFDDETKEEIKKRIDNGGQKLDEEVDETESEEVSIEEAEKLMESRYGKYLLKKIIKEEVDRYKSDEINEEMEEEHNLEVGKEYKTDSNMGGVFNVTYKGKGEDGKHNFEVSKGEFKGQKHSIKPENLKTYLVKENEMCEECTEEGEKPLSRYEKYLAKKSK